MMPASPAQITRCPQCATAFRITRTQLQSAKGLVRCGSCLHVFRATDHLLVAPASPTHEPEAPLASEHAPSVTEQPLETQENDITPVIDIPSTEEAISDSSSAQDTAPPTEEAQVTTIESLVAPEDHLDKDSADTPESAQPHAEKSEVADTIEPTHIAPAVAPDSSLLLSSSASLFEREPRKHLATPEFPEEDESWAEALIAQEEETAFAPLRDGPAALPEVDADDLAEADKLLATPLEGATELSFSAHYVQAPDQSDDESPATFSTEVIIQEEHAPEPTLRPSDAFELSPELAAIPDRGATQPSKEELASEPTEPPPVIAETKRQLNADPKDRVINSSRAELLKHIAPEPLEFSHRHHRRWSISPLWAGLSLCAVLLLVGQLAWFKFDYLSRIEPYRSLYGTVCPLIGCELPALKDTRKIAAQNLTIRPKPNVPNALAVDVIIINNATHDQPYPDLILRFTDINNQLVAARRFTPKEYLGGEAANSNIMPRQQPVYVTLDLVDPGDNAINYHIEIPSS